MLSVHFSNTKLSKIHPDVENDRSCFFMQFKPHVLFVFNVAQLWRAYFEIMSKIFKIRIKCCPFITFITEWK